jgi:ribosomal protein S18 acetylase RimI-like enzyme
VGVNRFSLTPLLLFAFLGRIEKARGMMMIEIGYANDLDFEYLSKNDPHILAKVLAEKIRAREVLVLKQDGKQIGWLRYGLFCDVIPFMNMLYIEESFRGKGFGRQLVQFWENEMRELGYQFVMTSSQSDEQAQHFYRKLRYKDTGSLTLLDEPLEIFFVKYL